MQLPLLCRMSSCCTSLSFSRYVGEMTLLWTVSHHHCKQDYYFSFNRPQKERGKHRAPVLHPELKACQVSSQVLLKPKDTIFFGFSFWNLPVSLSRKKRKVNLSLMFYFNIMLTSNIHLTFLSVYLFKKSILGYCQEFADAVMIRIVFISSPSEKLAKCTYKQLICKTGNKKRTHIWKCTQP